jgi:hypothetical protein
MIKIEKNYKAESSFRKDALWDSKRDSEFRISIFGLTLFKRTEDYKCDLSEFKETKNGCGFKKE